MSLDKDTVRKIAFLARIRVPDDALGGGAEELSNLIKYQQSFSAAAKVLSISDEMLDRLIEMKR